MFAENHLQLFHRLAQPLGVDNRDGSIQISVVLALLVFCPGEPDGLPIAEACDHSQDSFVRNTKEGFNSPKTTYELVPIPSFDGSDDDGNLLLELSELLHQTFEIEADSGSERVIRKINEFDGKDDYLLRQREWRGNGSLGRTLKRLKNGIVYMIDVDCHREAPCILC